MCHDHILTGGSYPRLPRSGMKVTYVLLQILSRLVQQFSCKKVEDIYNINYSLEYLKYSWIMDNDATLLQIGEM